MTRDKIHLWRSATAFFLAALLSACSGVDIDQAKQLANAGVTTSTRLQSEAKSTAAYMGSWREGRVFLAVLNEGDLNLKLKSDGSDIADLAKLLKKRADALGALSNTYKAFQELAVYDAAGNTEAAAANLFAETNVFLKTAKELPGTQEAASRISPLDLQVAEGISIGFGVIAREVQRAKLGKASIAIRTGVEKISEVLKAEQAYAISIRESVAFDRNELRRLARRRGLGSYDQPAKALLAEFDIDPVKDLDAAILRSSQATAAVDRILRDRFDAEMKTIGPAYKKLLDLLDALVQQHKQLEAGRRVSLTTIIALASELDDYYQRVHGAGSKPATN